ncbi:MAG: SsrA-binding protein SmpB [Chloroflexi bacterium]|nr:SsrA-binding protein SmpB [Chloroflexota bacterium]
MSKQDRVITANRKAYHDYSILESVEAGVVLTGTEIKSLREGRVNIREAYVKPAGGELWLVNAHIAQYASGTRYNHDPYRDRKLLLHRDQIARLIGAVSQKGLTLVPLKIYIKRGLAKVEVGLAKGKRLYEKREAIARRETERELHREVKLRHG